MTTLAKTETQLVDRIEEVGAKIKESARDHGLYHFRPGPRHRPCADHAAVRRPRPADRRAGPRQDEPGRDAWRRAWAREQAHPVHARPDALRHRRLGGAGREHGRPAQLPLRQGPDLHPAADGRRDQPRQPQDAVGAAPGDAGASRHRGRRPPRRAAPLPRARHAEPARAGRHLSPARGPARPLPACRSTSPIPTPPPSAACCSPPPASRSAR